MSHNKIKVNSQTQDTLGDISLNLNQVENTVTNIDDQVLMYQFSEWRAAPIPVTNKTLYYHKYYRDRPTGTTNYTYSNGQYWVWRTTTTIQPDEFVHSSVTRNAATAANTVFNSNGTFRESVTFSESGTYLFLFRISFGTDFSSSDSCDVQIHDSSAFSMKLHMNTEGKYGDMFWGIKTISSSTTFKIIINNIVGTVDVQEPTKRDLTSLAIYKL